MKIYVVCDLEGVAGVIDHRQQCRFDGKYFEQARRLATLELNALVEGVLEGGAREIVAWDGHGNFPGGLDVELLHSECRLEMGSGDGGPQGLDESFDALFQCGLHAMAGTKKAVMAHSFWGGIVGCWVNEIPVGEIWMNAYVAGSKGVPFVFLSGDRAAAEEAEKLVPEIEVAVVKEGLSSESAGLSVAPAISLAPEKARAVIRETARRAMGKIGSSVEPHRIEPPYTLRTQFTEAKLADNAMSNPDVRRIDETTVEIERNDFPWLIA
ncbi:MAG: M55 family metallopeptidase [Dehalococcoidales bacterium]|nr:MAG: M55 family metallopeptidase [Dehalococcoidales bacterium]